MATRTLYEVWLSFRSQPRFKSAVDSQKREAIRWARSRARTTYRTHYPRQVSVYVKNGTKRPTLIYQVHFNSKLKRLIAEEL